MITVFAVIGVIFTILFIVFSIDNSKNNHSASTYLNNQSFITKDSPQVRLCAFIIASTTKAMQEDISLKSLRGLEREKRMQFLLNNYFLGCISSKYNLAIQYGLPVPEVEKHIFWSFKELNQKFLLK